MRELIFQNVVAHFFIANPSQAIRVCMMWVAPIFHKKILMEYYSRSSHVLVTIGTSVSKVTSLQDCHCLWLCLVLGQAMAEVSNNRQVGYPWKEPPKCSSAALTLLIDPPPPYPPLYAILVNCSKHCALGCTKISKSCRNSNLTWCKLYLYERRPKMQKKMIFGAFS